MVPMRAHTRHLSLLQRGHARIRGLAWATFFGLLLVGLLAGCGSGGSSGGGTTGPTTSVTQTVGSAGGTVSLSDGSTVVFNSGVLKDGTSVTVSSSPQLPNPLPEGAQLLSQSVTVQFSGGGLADVPGQGASITIDLPSAQSSLASRFLQLISPKTVFAQTTVPNPHRLGVVTIGTGTGDSGRTLYGFDVPTALSATTTTRLIIPVIDLQAAPAFTAYYTDITHCYPTSPTPILLYRVKSKPLVKYVFELIPDSQKIQVTTGKTPLILVHGIQLKHMCDMPYQSTWENVIGPLLDDESFMNQFEIFSVHYDSTQSIYENGQALANRLSGSDGLSGAFGATPVVILAHSMGGLVTRAALTPVPPRNFPPANIAGLVTLGTPHTGTPIASFEGYTAAKNSGGSWREFLFSSLLDKRAQGYVDLASDQLRFNNLASTEANPVLGNPALSKLKQCERGELPGCESLGSRKIYGRIVALAGRLGTELVTTTSMWSDLLCQHQMKWGEDNDDVVPTDSALFLPESLLDRQDFRGYAHTGLYGIFHKFCDLQIDPAPSPPKSITDFSQSNSDVAVKVKSSLRRFLQSPPPPPPSTPVDVTGTWQGTYSDNFEPTPQSTTLNLTQTGTSVTGSWTSQFASNGGGIVSGTFTGSLSGSTMTFTMTQTQTSLGPCSGSFSGTATVTGNSTSATYSGSDCRGLHNNGQVSVTKQASPQYQGTWSPTGSMATGRYLHTATLLPNGKVLVVGEGGALASAELYDPATGVWTSTGSLTTARLQHTATLLPNGKVLVAGGGGGLASAELYDPATGTWSSTGSLVTGRTYHTATLLPNGKVLVVGGSGYLASAELYDPATGTWSSTGSLVTGRYWHTATLLPNGKVLVVGGFAVGDLTASAELYDPATGAWSPTGSLATRRELHTATLLPNGKVLVVGGAITVGLASVELYDPATGAWSPTGSLATARYDHTATLLPNGKVLAAGGFGYPASAELYQ